MILRRELVALGLLAASTQGCVLWASKSDYADYRAVRMTSDDHARVLAMQNYVAHHPDGQWAEGFQAERQSREAEIYESGKTSKEGLEFYLQAYPEGTYVAQARPRLAALQSVTGHRTDEAQHAQEAQAERRRLRDEQRRTWVTRAVGYWAKTLFGVTNWGAPIPEVARTNPAFSRAFGENPRPRCTRDECDKFYQNAYAIPVPGATRIDRTVQIVLRLKMESANVERAELLLPNRGFSRWYEMENRVAVTDEDPTQREQVRNWVLERLVPVVTQGLTDAQVTDTISAIPAIKTLDFTPEGTRTGTSTPGSGGSDSADDDDDDATSATPAAAAQTAVTPATAAEPAPAETAPAATTTNATPTVEELLARHSGTQQAANAEVAPVEAAPVAPAQAIAPQVIRAFITPTIRVVVFMAGDDDYSTSYDGIYIEHIRAEAEAAPAAVETPAVAPQRGPVRPGRGTQQPAAHPGPGAANRRRPNAGN